MFLILIRWFSKSSFRKWGRSYCLCTLSVRLFQRRVSREDIANVVALTWVNEVVFAVPGDEPLKHHCNHHNILWSTHISLSIAIVITRYYVISVTLW